MGSGGTVETSHTRALAVALAVAAGLSLPWSVQPYWDPRPDAARYILAARSLARGEGYAYWGVPFTLRPPGFSALLAPLLAWRGLDFTALNLFVSLLGVLACVLFYLLLAPRTGAPVAAAAAAALWLNPLFQRLSNQVMSDVPGLAMALAALLVMRGSREGSRAVRGDAMAAVLMAAAAYVRAANLALVPAFVLDRAPAVRRAAAPVGLTIALLVPWVLHASMASRRVAGVTPSLESYWTAAWRSDATDPDSPALDAAGWGERGRSHAVAYAGLLGTDLAPQEPGGIGWTVALFVLAGWLASALRRREASDAYTGVMIAILLAYYTSAPRLFLPVFVLVWGGALDTARWLAGKRLPARLVDVLLVAGVLAGAAAHFRADFMTPDSRARYADLLEVCRHLRDAAPQESLAGDVGVVYGVLLDRPVYSLRPAMRDGGLAAALDMIERYRVDRVVLDRAGACAPLLREAGERGAQVLDFGRYAVVRWSRPGAARGREAAPLDERRRIHFDAAEAARTPGAQ